MKSKANGQGRGEIINKARARSCFTAAPGRKAVGRWGRKTLAISSPEPVFSPSLPLTAILDFVLLSHHASPREAVQELDLLFDVCMELIEHWKTQVLHAGD